MKYYWLVHLAMWCVHISEVILAYVTSDKCLTEQNHGHEVRRSIWDNQIWSAWFIFVFGETSQSQAQGYGTMQNVQAKIFELLWKEGKKKRRNKFGCYSSFMKFFNILEPFNL